MCLCASRSNHHLPLGEIKILIKQDVFHCRPHQVDMPVIVKFFPITYRNTRTTIFTSHNNTGERACYTVNTFFRLLRNGILYCSLGFSSLYQCKQTIQCLLKLRRRLRLKLFRCSGPHKLVTSPYTWYPILSCSILFKARLMCEGIDDRFYILQQHLLWVNYTQFLVADLPGICVKSKYIFNNC